MPSPVDQQKHSIGFATIKPGYATYKSPYGPRWMDMADLALPAFRTIAGIGIVRFPSYKLQPNIGGLGPQGMTRLATTLGAFGVVAGIFALQFFSDVPKVRKDICQKLPIVGDYFVREVPPSDNPF